MHDIDLAQSRYLWDKNKFPNVSQLIEQMSPTKLILWEHPILDITTDGCAQIIQVDGKRVCVKSDGYHLTCCPAPADDSDGRGSNAGAPCPGLNLTRPKPPCRNGWWAQAGVSTQPMLPCTSIIRRLIDPF